MKYFVTVGGRELVVAVEGGRVVVDGAVIEAAHLTALPGTPIRYLSLDGASHVLALEAVGRGLWAVGFQGERHELDVIDERTRHIRSLTGGSAKAIGPTLLKAPMPGLVVLVAVAEGQKVEAGSTLVVLEAMKMENELRATGPGVIKSVKVKAGQPVEKGQVLVEFEVSSGAAA